MTQKIDIGIEETARQNIAAGLGRVLADSYTLYLKTHNFHWNVTGPQFNTLHTLFEAHYTELALAVDEIAERIRALGIKAPGSYRDYAKLTAIEEAEGDPAANEMVAQLTVDHETVARTIRTAMPRAADANDDVSVDLLTQRLAIHEKTAWMLRSMQED
ncbi:MAG: Dps family protein [Alphaproteobacteria bacterium]